MCRWPSFSCSISPVLPFVTQRYFYGFLQQFYSETQQDKIDSRDSQSHKTISRMRHHLLQKYKNFRWGSQWLTTGGRDDLHRFNPIFQPWFCREISRKFWCWKNKFRTSSVSMLYRRFSVTAPLGFSFSDGTDPKRQFVTQVLCVCSDSISYLFCDLWDLCCIFFEKHFQPIRAVTDTLDNFTTVKGKCSIR